MDQSLLDYDACSIVELLRQKKLSVNELLDSCIKDIKQSRLNAICYLDEDLALGQAQNLNLNLPFAGIPFGIKELDHVEGWPNSQACLVLKDRVSDYNSTFVDRLIDAGALILAQTTASEFGGINLTRTKLHGITRNPWNLERTPGGSSGGSAAAVAGGLLPIASGSDGGGSIRIPAGFTNLFGLKVTYGLVPKGPFAEIGALTGVFGALTKSVRDCARFLDVVCGYDRHDPLSEPVKGDFEQSLGKSELKGRTVTVSADLFGHAVVARKVADLVIEGANNLIKLLGLKEKEVKNVKIPPVGVDWAASNLVGILAELGDKYPECAQELTPEINFGLNVSSSHYNLRSAAQAHTNRMLLNEALANCFDQVDFVITATNPDVAFNAEGPLPTTVDGRDLLKERGFLEGAVNNGALTIPANIYGSPAITLPVGFVDGLPVGMQVMSEHFREKELLDIALSYEKAYPWQKVAPGSPI